VDGYEETEHQIQGILLFGLRFWESASHHNANSSRCVNSEKFNHFDRELGVRESLFLLPVPDEG
jgi:hypothetical protein